MRKFSEIQRKPITTKDVVEKMLFESDKITSDKQFKDWAEKVLKNAFGDKFDEAKFNKTVDGLLKKYGENYGAMVGALSYGLAESQKENVNKLYEGKNKLPDWMEKILKQFPLDAKNWGDATDEILNLANYIDDVLEIDTNTKKSKTPAEWNQQHVGRIINNFPKLSEKEIRGLKEYAKDMFEILFESVQVDYDKDSGLVTKVINDVKKTQAKCVLVNGEKYTYNASEKQYKSVSDEPLFYNSDLTYEILENKFYKVDEFKMNDDKTNNFKTWALTTATLVKPNVNNKKLIDTINKIEREEEEMSVKMGDFLEFIYNESIQESDNFKQWALDTSTMVKPNANNKKIIDVINKIEKEKEDVSVKMLKFLDYLGSLNEAKVTSNKDFEEYANTVLKKAFGDKFDQKVADKMVKDLQDKYKDDFGAMVGALTSGLGELEIVEENVTLIAQNKEGATVEFKGKSKKEAFDSFKKEYDTKGWKIKYHDANGKLLEVKQF